jgi:hypothetical protein
VPCRGKIFKKKLFFIRVPGGWALGKEFFKKKFFAECYAEGHSTKFFLKK